MGLSAPGVSIPPRGLAPLPLSAGNHRTVLSLQLANIVTNRLSIGAISDLVLVMPAKLFA